jgi:hypothetical protein
MRATRLRPSLDTFPGDVDQHCRSVPIPHFAFPPNLLKPVATAHEIAEHATWKSILDLHARPVVERIGGIALR